MILYGNDISPFTARIEMILRTKGVAYETTMPEDGVHGAAFTAINPLERMPALDTGNQIIAESDVIAEYLETVYPEPSLMGSNAGEAADIRLLTRLTDLYIMNNLVLGIQAAMADPPKPEIVPHAGTLLLRGYKDVDHVLAQQGKQGATPMTMADTILVPTLVFAEAFQSLLGQRDALASFPALTAYWQNVQSDPMAAEIIASMKAALDAYRKG